MPGCELAPATAIGVLVRNLVLGREPVYALGRVGGAVRPGVCSGSPTRRSPRSTTTGSAGRWPGCSTPTGPSLLTRLVLGAVERFGIDCSQLHNDSTSITLTGGYGDGRRASPRRQGHRRDHLRPQQRSPPRPQTAGVDPHRDRRRCGADRPSGGRRQHQRRCHPHRHLERAGRAHRPHGFPLRRRLQARQPRRTWPTSTATVAGSCPCCPLPARRTRRFATGSSTTNVEWVQAIRRPGRRQHDPDDVWHTVAAPWPSAEGHRVVWVRSSTKIEHDAQARTDRIARGIAALDDLNQRLASPKTRMKTTVAVEAAAAAALDQTGAARWIHCTVARNSRWARDRDCRALRRRVERQRHSRNPTQRLPRRPRVATPAGWSRRGPDSNPRAKRVGEHATSGWVTSLGAESAMASVMRWTRSTG